MTRIADEWERLVNEHPEVEHQMTAETDRRYWMYFAHLTAQARLAAVWRKNVARPLERASAHLSTIYRDARNNTR